MASSMASGLYITRRLCEMPCTHVVSHFVIHCFKYCLHTHGLSLEESGFLGVAFTPKHMAGESLSRIVPKRLIILQAQHYCCLPN